MRRCVPLLTLWLAWAGSAHAHGLLIPDEKTVPPLAMVHHRVHIAIEDQVAVTKVEQTFRNHTDRELEATYVFPVPKGASVNKFTMWVGGKEVAGEMVEADKARQVYTDLVRRTQDPGLLEYLGNNLLRMRVFPIPPKADQKVTLSFTALAPRDAGVVEYVYPLKTDGKATRTLEEFSIQATIKSQHPILNVYSPTHAISLKRANDREAAVTFENSQGLLDKDFQLFYATGDREVGFTMLTHRPVSGEKGYFLLLLTPRVELSKDQYVPRDLVFVLDTSGSMRGAKMDQAKRALKYCLDNLNPKDRFALLNFATTVNRYSAGLVDTTPDQVAQARKWVDNLDATGGTAINDALAAALELRPSDQGRTFTLVFFTDGLPTIGETNAEKILKNVTAKNTANTRVFTFGVGDDVNATLLDQLAEQSRAVSTYVRPAEDIEVKVSSLYSKISHPVLANLKLTTGGDVRFDEVYPPQLPDLFHGGQLVALGRYAGQGPTAVTLSGSVGTDARDFVYEVAFPDKTGDERAFVEHVWARRKVGYLLDQIRANGDKKELVDEVVALAKKYGIATPYTSYLIVPDAPLPVVNGEARLREAGAARSDRPNVSFGLGGMPGGGLGGFAGGGPGAVPTGLAPAGPRSDPQKVLDFARGVQKKPGDLADNRGKFEDEKNRRLPATEGKGGTGDKDGAARVLYEAAQKKEAYDQAREALGRRLYAQVQAGKLGVDLSVQTNNLRTLSRLEQTALRRVANRNCLEIGGVWIDEGFDAKLPVVAVKALSEAYFRILERHPQVKDVFRLGNHLVWVTPSNTALVIDLNDGQEKLTDAEIDRLFVAPK
jgi:Ca-activated chloride channel family protein